MTIQPMQYRCGIERPSSKRPAEGLALDRRVDALASGMNPPATTGKCSGRIRNDVSVSRDNPQQSGVIGTKAAAEARSCRNHVTSSTRHARLAPRRVLDRCPRARLLHPAWSRYQSPPTTARSASRCTLKAARPASVALSQVRGRLPT